MTGSILAFAWGAVLRRRARSLALGGGLVFAVALVAAVLFLTEALRREADRAEDVQPDIVVQKLTGGRPTTIAASERERILDIASVRTVTPRVWGYVFLPSLQGNVTVVGTSGAEPSLDVASGTLEEGRDLVVGKHEMLAGSELAKFFGMQPGDMLTLPSLDRRGPTLTMVGTFRSALDLWTSDVVMCDDTDARSLLGMPPERATDLAVILGNPQEAKVVAAEISSRIPGARVLERDLLARVHRLAYGRRAGLVLGATLPALLALLVLAWDRASGVGPEEKKEISVLKAVGWSTVDVLWAKLFESLLVGTVATALGLLVAYAWVFWLGAPGLREALVGWGSLYPRSPLTPAVDLAQVLGIALAVLGPFALLSVVPAWRAATTDPMDVMRG